MTINEAVKSGLVNNETLGYFMTRTQMWLESIGIDPNRMRLRQHLKTEMAHYAADCWDMEILMSYGWIECVGHADRACYDLIQHSQRTGVAMVASERLIEPILVEKIIAEPNKKLIGPRFKLEQKHVIAAIEALEGEELDIFKTKIETDKKAILKDCYEITSDLVTFSLQKRIVSETKYTPSVIEPSFGIGRILYALLEHSFSQRNGDEQRCVMSFNPIIAPIKVGIYRLINHPPFDPIVNRIKNLLHDQNITCKIDSSSGTVGRRYSRADELGIPFGITIDFQTLIDHSVTLRDRDSMKQIRVPYNQLLLLIQQLVTETISWEIAMSRFVIIKSNNNEIEENENELVDNNNTSIVDNTPVIIEYNTRGSFNRPNPLYQK